jgi:hypothetical protein
MTSDDSKPTSIADQLSQKVNASHVSEAFAGCFFPPKEFPTFGK